jgi:gliding motility-associated-like protein
VKTTLHIVSLMALLLFVVSDAFSTHNRAGEITYKRLSHNTYEITVTTYTEPSSTQADRCEVKVLFGDGKSDSIPRINGLPKTGCNHGGEKISTNVQKNVYRTTHSYAGNGTYEIVMTDPNRVDNIENIPGSVGVPFTIKTTLRIHPILGANNSPVLQNPPIEDACVCKPYYHNPGALDPDGDSLSYSLSICYGNNGEPIPGYTLPSVHPGCGTQDLSINPVTGTLTWNAPARQGRYNVCILITEWRKIRLPNKAPYWDTVGNVLRDMQINVTICNNDPPIIAPLADLCVIAGDTINEEIKAYDEPNQYISLEAFGEPFNLINSRAHFSKPQPKRDSIKGDFTWNTQCSHVRVPSYLVTFKAKDSIPSVRLTNYKTLTIKIIGPAVTNLNLNTGLKSMRLSWSSYQCANASGFRIYRKVDSSKWDPGNCETGVPKGLGFELIATVNGHSKTSFEDDNNGKGLFHGLIYCYRVVAIFPDGAEGVASNEVCGELPFNTAIITRNSVAITDRDSGVDSLAFAKPQELDLAPFQGPYSFKVFQKTESGNNEIYTSQKFQNWNSIDTSIRIENVNTEDVAQVYFIDLLNDGKSMGTTHEAPSVFLSIKPDDKKLNLLWEAEVPWKNFKYIIHKEMSNSFVAIDTVDTNYFLDVGLINGREYRYYVESMGKYSIEQLKDTLLNKSQIAVGVPIDTIPPCSPDKPIIESDCEEFWNKLTWNNPNDSCFYKDALRYKLYFTPIVGGEYRVIQEFSDIESDTTATFENLTSVAGCYAVSAVDTFDNESPLSTRVCVDNCPIYRLPNVFTPGGDGYNDFFTPIYPFRYVKDIDLSIYNRWGQVMFETTNPHIRWDGKSSQNGEQVPSGVYFYTCVVNEIRLVGIVPRILKGYVTVVNESNPKLSD